MRRVLAALCLLLGLSTVEAQVTTVWTNQAATATSSAIDTGRAQHVNIQITGSSVVGTVAIQRSNDCSTWSSYLTLTDPANEFRTVPSWACTRLVFTRTSGTVTLATIEPVRTGRNGTMVGATSGADGVGGLVPLPAAGDEAKCLLGDGTWGTCGSGGSGDVESVTLTGTAPVTVTGSPCASADCAFTLALTGVTLDANGWTQSVPVTGGDANKGYAWTVATDGGYPDFGMSLVLGGLTLTGDDQEFHARKQITVHANASGGAIDGFCFEKAAAEVCMVFDFTGNVLQLPTVALANPLAVADGGTGVASFGQNTVLAGPTSGGAGTATARALVAGDLPTVPVSSGGTGGTDASTARTNLGLVIGTDVQAYSLNLAGLAGLSNGIPWRNSTWAVTSPTDGTVPYYTAAGGLLSTEQTRVAQDSYAQRRGTNAQTAEWCMTYTDASNYACLRYSNSGTVQQLMTRTAGTGTTSNAGGFQVGAATGGILFYASNALTARLLSTNFMPETGDAIDLGNAANPGWKTLYLARGQQGSKSKALTESTATSFLRMAIPSGSSRGIKVTYTVRAADATDFQSLSGEVWLDGSNKAGTISVGTISERQATCACSTGTLTATITVVDAGSGNLEIKADATSSLTQTTLAIDYTPVVPVIATLTNL